MGTHYTLVFMLQSKSFWKLFLYTCADKIHRRESQHDRDQCRCSSHELQSPRRSSRLGAVCRAVRYCYRIDLMFTWLVLCQWCQLCGGKRTKKNVQMRRRTWLSKLQTSELGSPVMTGALLQSQSVPKGNIQDENPVQDAYQASNAGSVSR